MKSSPSPTESGHENRSEPARVDSFADAVQAVMTLPLSDKEKAEAVRRLLAGQSAKRTEKFRVSL